MISREEILKLSAGREMDILVAEHVMGWQIETDRGKLKRLNMYVSHAAERTWWRDPQGGWHCDPLRYSSDIVSAWKVVGSLNGKGQTLFLFQNLEENRASFDGPGATDSDYMTGADITVAICKAALASVARPLQVASLAGIFVK